jgi:hypothetical protein
LFDSINIFASLVFCPEKETIEMEKVKKIEKAVGGERERRGLLCVKR